MRTRVFVTVGVLVALLLAGVVSYYASSAPDGLTRVARDQGITAAERRHAAHDGPFAGYRTTGVENGRLSTGLAGVAGTLVVLLLAGGLTWSVRRGRRDPAPEVEAEAQDAGPHATRTGAHREQA
ncbi:PDGLE domain-containing protein [Nocardioides mesophilus]|uniref:PDGLE domain-containing protein n=1 Tax=Nocardioides mesophilus TaxID=433659 RepID=A0A7G9RD13_9ACTN|nr:PDGLE domain-containing protein [Nocardioides mesophilus]QNN53488.1 PDGLE domain-containing protein [Nocardioides mesophilus]